MFQFGRYFGALEKDQLVEPAAQETAAAWAEDRKSVV